MSTPSDSENPEAFKSASIYDLIAEEQKRPPQKPPALDSENPDLIEMWAQLASGFVDELDHRASPEYEGERGPRYVPVVWLTKVRPLGFQVVGLGMFQAYTGHLAGFIVAKIPMLNPEPLFRFSRVLDEAFECITAETPALPPLAEVHHAFREAQTFHQAVRTAAAFQPKFERWRMQSDTRKIPNVPRTQRGIDENAHVLPIAGPHVQNALTGPAKVPRRKRAPNSTINLIAFMKEREKASYEEIGFHVIGDRYAKETAIRKLVSRANTSQETNNSKIRFRCNSGYVVKDESSE